MAAEFPTSVANFTNPNPVTDDLDTAVGGLTHSGQHGKVNDEIEATQTKIGTGSSTPTSGKVLRATGTGTSNWSQITNADVDAAAAIIGTKIDIHTTGAIGAPLADADEMVVYDASATANKMSAVTRITDYVFSQNIALTGDISPSSIGASQNDYNPTGLSTASTLRLTSSAAYNITGLAGGADGRIILLHNIGSYILTLVDESASSTAGNRFALTADQKILPDEMAALQYDSTSSRWRVLAPRAASVVRTVYTGSTDDSVTSGTAVALTDPIPSITTQGGDLLVWIRQTINASTSAICGLYLQLDAGAFQQVANVSPPSSAGRQTVSGFHVFTGVSAGAHTITPGGNTNAGTVTYYGGLRKILILEMLR